MPIRSRLSLALAALAAAVLLAGTAVAQTATVTFLHLNDVYEISPRDGRGGFAPLMTLLQRERAAAPGALTTFGGDLLSSSMMSGITQGAQMIELMNAVGLDLAVVGNHEFDFGPDVLRQRVGESRFPWLGANVLGPDGRLLPGLVATQTRKVGDVTIGFLGLVTPDTSFLSSPGPGLRFAPVLDTARAAVARLRAEGADAIVALTHLTIAEDRALAREVEGIDVILGGHEHDPITFYEGGVFIFKVGSDAHYLGVARIQVEKTATPRGPRVTVWPREWRVVTTAGVPEDPAIAAIVRRHEDGLEASLGAAVGTTRVDLDSRPATLRRGEGAIGNLVADALREFTGADVAIFNGGGIRGGRTYPAGTALTRRDVLTELPFRNVAVLIELSGADLRMALEEGVSAIEEGAGRFPQVSGLTFAFDPRRPRLQRVLSVAVGGRPLDPAATYRVATSNYLMAGGDGYAALKRGRAVVDAGGGPLVATVVMDYITRRGTVAPAVEGRIVEVK